MGVLVEEVLAFRTLVSIAGIVGNAVLILSIFQMPRKRTFDLFLIGLAFANLEEIITVDVYDIFVFRASVALSPMACRTLKFFSASGEFASILFTVLISIYRYQKLRDAQTRVNLPVLMDKRRPALLLSGGSVVLAAILSAPCYIMNLDGHVRNFTSQTNCPPDFFQCAKNNCPFRNKLYKYVFMCTCILAPLLCVTGTSCLILRILLIRQCTVAAQQRAQSSQGGQHQAKSSGLNRSTIAVLAAMWIFQIDWMMYLVLQFALSPYDFPAWTEMEFFITTSYSSLSPYVDSTG
ncbi:uncharacterized protein ora6 [Denticeps clupeoides]|uniref:uncharacterized protein ora6 n=1 Tax=Denticeps clupeoides TaxID=299321 RepID=UPI0010A2C54D|nr:uncharacterized protein LOC114763700 [Denticeps clupeoides]